MTLFGSLVLISKESCLIKGMMGKISSALLQINLAFSEKDYFPVYFILHFTSIPKFYSLSSFRCPIGQKKKKKMQMKKPESKGSKT